MNTFYRIARVLVRIAMFFAHPVFRVSGRENIPEGPAVICCNHSNLSDPIWVILGLWPEHMPACMAKKEVMQVPLLGALLRFLGAISVDRGNADLNAVKQALKALKDGNNLLVFPEGTRVRPRKVVDAKTGAALLANRAGVPLLPVFLTRNKKFFCPLKLVIGKPFFVEKQGARITQQELQLATDHLMGEIYAMEEQ
ncbi:MAG: 1-acyl-sn-glycerol-3-phosphate acyltransferase [Ruminococcaceae bacterium]|nr:1-acyl-sn-glycerol-3-phosphate acyltransferase [Oscillospiraceae bacterium]